MIPTTWSPSAASTLRSLFSPEAAAALLREQFGLEVVGCELVRSFVNDVYVAQTPSGRCILKIYRHGRLSAEEVGWEQELARHLGAYGIAVAAPVPLLDGRLAGTLAAPEGARAFAVTGFVDGAKPQPPFTDALYRDYGELAARVHAAGDTFVSALPRRAFDPAAELAASLGLVLPQLAGRPADQDAVRGLGGEAAGRIRKLAAAGGLRRGVCHGDLTLDNVLIRPGGTLAVYDFDLARPGWPAADLIGVQGKPGWEAFAAGYDSVRLLCEDELAALPWLEAAATIGNLGFHLVDKPTFRGSESIAEGWSEREITRLRELAEQLL